MKKFLALIMVLVIMSSTLTSCSKQPTVDTFDYAGITIDIIDGYDITGSYSNEFEPISQTISFTLDKYNSITIMYLPGEWVPDDNGEFSVGGSNILKTIDEKKYQIDNYEARYGNYKVKDTNGETVFNQVLSIFLDDRWVMVQTFANDNETNNTIKKYVIDSVGISDNQYYFPGFGKNNNSITTTKPEPPKSTEIIDLNDLHPSPTLEPTENPFQYEYYGYGDLAIPIPINFTYSEQFSGTDVFEFISDDGKASFLIQELDVITDPNGIYKSQFLPGANILNKDDYNQDYFNIDGNVIKSHISYLSYEYENYENFDILVCYDEYTLFISMSGPAEYHDIFEIPFNYIGVQK